MITNGTRKIVKERRTARVWVQMMMDHIVVQGLLFFHTLKRTEEFSDEYRVLAIVTFLLMILIYSWVGVYRRQNANNDYVTCLLQAWGLLVLVLGLFGFVTKTSETFSREVILTWAVSGFLAQLVIYYVTRKILFHAMSETIPTLMVGGGDLGKHIANHINGNQWIPDHIVGVVDDDPGVEASWKELEIPYMGCLEDVISVVSSHNIRRVYIAIPMTVSGKVKPLALELVDTNVDVIWAPDILGVSLLNHSVNEIAGVPLISLSETPLLGGSALAKTVMDKVLASIALVLVLPLMLMIALAVKLSSPGPVFFKQKRHGWDGRIVEIYKFRSMKVHEESHGQVTQATKDDDRVTAVGSFIRRTSLDELPQLLNVIGGSMSLVGPRPHAIAHNEYYKGKIGSYMMRHRIKPGLTGLAQVNGFRGETDTIDKMQNRVNYDLAYINNWSIWLDMEIMFRTIFVLLSKNAY